MAQARHHVPFDGTAHVVMLGGEPEDMTVGHVEDEDPGVTFWAEPGDQPQLFRVFGWDDFLTVGGAVLIGEARVAHGMRRYLYALPGDACAANRPAGAGSPGLDTGYARRDVALRNITVASIKRGGRDSQLPCGARRQQTAYRTSRLTGIAQPRRS